MVCTVPLLMLSSKTLVLYETEGLTLIQKESRNMVHTVIRNVTFLGTMFNYSKGLSVKYTPCSRFSLTAFQVSGWNFICDILETSFGEQTLPHCPQKQVYKLPFPVWHSIWPRLCDTFATISDLQPSILQPSISNVFLPVPLILWVVDEPQSIQTCCASPT